MTTATLEHTLVKTQTMMRALTQFEYGEPDVLKEGEVARPTAGKGEVVVEVKAAGLDRASWHLVTGRPWLARLFFGLRAPSNPVPGREVAGVVVEVGAGVTRLSVGDEVFGIGEGSFAAFARAKEMKVVKKPARLSFEEAAVSGVSGLTANEALVQSGLRAGESVLVVGASGGVGTFAVQLARAMGAKVTGVCSTSKVDLVRSLGVEDVIDYQREDFTAREAKFDVILDVGGRTKVSKLRRVLAPAGRLVFVGGEGGGDFSGGMSRQMFAPLLQLFSKQKFIPLMPNESLPPLERLAAALETSSVQPVIERTIGLKEVPSMMRALADGKVRGKIAVRPV